MAAIHNSLGKVWSGKGRNTSITVLIALIGIAGLVVLFGPLSHPSQTASAAPLAVGNEPWIKIVCLQKEVEEGDDFRLRVDKKYDSHWPHESIKVWWYTHPITADETDYEHLHQERQYSNGHQSATGRMGRTFHTLEDNYPEIDETFIVEYLNGVSKGPDGKCEMTITDDDGVGIYDLEVTSTPRELPAPDGEKPKVGYAEGDVIEITAHFTGDVTTVNPDTGEQAGYAGINVFVGNQRRLATFLRSDGSDALIFAYEVKAYDLDTDGISVEQGGLPLIGPSFPSYTGFNYDRRHRDIGIWPVSTEHESINRWYHGLDNDRAHRVFQIKIDEPTIIDPPTETEVPPVPQPDPEPPPVWVENSVDIPNGSFHIEHGELTEEDGGRDWFRFTAIGGEPYIIEVESRMELLEEGTPYVEDKLVDPSILEILNEQGEQVMGEQDSGGFIWLWARGYFQPEEDGTYYIAVGNGAQDRTGTGHYTISVRQDDHADDSRTNPDVVLRPNQSIAARINSDVAPGDTTNPNAWVWAETEGGNAVPRWGIEASDDMDVFRFKIAEAGTYRIEMIDGPAGVGLWAIWRGEGSGGYLSRERPVDSFVDHFNRGTHYFAVGTPYQSVGNTGDYTVALTSGLD